MAAAGDPRGGETPTRPFMRRPEDVFPHAWGFEEKYKQYLCRLFSGILWGAQRAGGRVLTHYVSIIMSNEKGVKLCEKNY